MSDARREGGKTVDAGAFHCVSFYDAASDRQMRYIYPDAGHWCAGWILRQTAGGQWETCRKATDADIAAINGAVVRTLP